MCKLYGFCKFLETWMIDSDQVKLKQRIRNGFGDDFEMKLMQSEEMLQTWTRHTDLRTRSMDQFQSLWSWCAGEVHRFLSSWIHFREARSWFAIQIRRPYLVNPVRGSSPLCSCASWTATCNLFPLLLTTFPRNFCWFLQKGISEICRSSFLPFQESL